MRWLLLLLLLPFSVWAGTYGACTKGTNCYCDQVADSGSDLYDPNVLLCEDWEAPTLRLDQGYGDGGPFYGPWYDPTGFGDGTSRGYNSYWSRKYTNGPSGLWQEGEPSSPTVGAACGYPTCHGLIPWDSEDRWDGNAYSPNIAIYDEDSDFPAEDSGNVAPSNAAGGGSGIFDGIANMVFRIPAGDTHTILGTGEWTASTHIGCTFAVALSNNFTESGLLFGEGQRNWKWNEFVQVANPNFGFDALCGFGDTNDPSFPSYGFILADGGGGCAGVISGATMHVGDSMDCGDDYLRWWGSASVYEYATEWGDAEWACVRAETDIASGVIKMWILTDTLGEETLAFHASGLDFSGTNPASGYDGIKWNAYANVNQGGGAGPTTETVFRYEDNFHITSGTPVSCAAIGFGQEAQPDTSPSTGVSLTYFGLAALAGLLVPLFRMGRRRKLTWAN